jgi:hypothetical protein
MKNRIAVLLALLSMTPSLVHASPQTGTAFSGPTIPPGPWDDDDSSSGDTKFLR